MANEKRATHHDTGSQEAQGPMKSGWIKNKEGPDTDKIEDAIELISKTGLKIIVKRDIQDLLGVNIRKEKNTVKFARPQLVKRYCVHLVSNYQVTRSQKGVQTRAKTYQHQQAEYCSNTRKANHTPTV